MRTRMLLVALTGLGGAFGSAQIAAAQEAAPGATPSVASYLCTFAGKCDGVDDGPQATRDAPDTKGFRFARPTAEQPRAAAVARPSATARQPSRVTAVRPRGSGGSYSGRPSRMVASTAAANLAMSPARPRANLMIGFELNSAQLSAEGVNAAQVFARSLLMPELSGKRFLIEGHTDLRGGRAINRTLSAKRAQAVADYLVVLGVDRGRLQTRGYGADAPLPGRRASDPSNRRVEAELIS